MADWIQDLRKSKGSDGQDSLEDLAEVLRCMIQAGDAEGWNERDFLAVFLGELWGLEANAPYGEFQPHHVFV